MKKWIALGLAIAAAVLLLLLPDTPKKQYFHNQGNIFGTYYNIRYEATEDLHDSILHYLQVFDQSLSMFNQQSIISRINRNDSVTTDDLFNTMFREAMAISQLSDGAFDITVRPLVNAWGFGTKSQEPRAKTSTWIASKPLLVTIRLFSKVISCSNPTLVLPWMQVL